MDILNSEQSKSFIDIALAIFKEKNGNVGEFQDDVILIEFAAWADTNGYKNAPMGEAIDAFREWVRDVHNQPKRVSNLVTLSVVVERNYGSVAVSFGETSTWEIANGTQYYLALNRMTDSLWACHDAWVKDKAGSLPKTNHTTNATSSAQDTRVVRFTRRIHNFVDGKHRVNLAGGAYEKYGVAIYPEVGEPLWGAYDALPMGEVAMTGDMVIEMSPDGRPLRVIEVR